MRFQVVLSPHFYSQYRDVAPQSFPGLIGEITTLCSKHSDATNGQPFRLGARGNDVKGLL